MCGTFRSLGLDGDWNAQYWILDDGTLIQNDHYRSNPKVDDELHIPRLIRESTSRQYFFVFDIEFPPSLDLIKKVGKLVVAKNINSGNFSELVTLDEAFPEFSNLEGPNIFFQSIPGEPIRAHRFSSSQANDYCTFEERYPECSHAECPELPKCPYTTDDELRLDLDDVKEPTS